MKRNLIALSLLLMLAAASPAAASHLAPTPTFTATPSPAAPGQQVTFDATATLCPHSPCDSYSWSDDGADGPSGTNWALGSGQMLRFTFKGIGTKYVRLTVTDDGRSASVMRQLVVRNSPPASDRDGDGFPDGSDVCPDTAGQSPDGCPPVVPPPPPPPPPASGQPWSKPTPRANYVGPGGPCGPFRENTFYDRCTGLSIPDSASARRFTCVNCRPNLPTIARGWTDFWIGGTPSSPMNAGPRRDGKDLIQVKATPAGVVPSDGVFAFIDFHDISRPSSGTGSTGHPDGVQLMAGQRIVFGGVQFRNMGAAVQPWFLKRESPSAGGGTVANVDLFASTFSNITHSCSACVAGNTLPAYPDVEIANNKLGGTNAKVDRATVNAAGFRFDGNANGGLTVVVR